MKLDSFEMAPSRLEVLKSMEGFVRENLPQLLRPVENSWQPSSFLPQMESHDCQEELRALRERAALLPDELLVVLIGDMITEEALPSYQTWINLLEGLGDPLGEGTSPWGEWSRGWTAEENRHGDMLNKYLTLTGRVNMPAVEKTIHYLIRNGFNPGTENDPYMGFIYTSFQERATQISHKNCAILAGKFGDSQLQLICGTIAGDEARHAKAYELFILKIFELDPEGALLAFAKMMKKQIVMPARLMTDGVSPTLYDDFSCVAQNWGVYTAHDYTSIMESLIESWGIAHLKGLSAEALQAQDYLLGLVPRYRKLAERRKATAVPKNKFSWVFNRI